MLKFEERACFELNSLSDSELEKLLRSSSIDTQFHFKTTNATTILVQYDTKQKGSYLMCEIVQHGNTAWEKIELRQLLNLINQNRAVTDNQLSLFGILTRAIEGKRFGEY